MHDHWVEDVSDVAFVADYNPPPHQKQTPHYCEQDFKPANTTPLSWASSFSRLSHNVLRCGSQLHGISA
jgi:hypothetical protein